MRALVVLSSVALVVAGGAQATLPRGILAGIVMRGPTSPVCVIGQPCDEPAANVTLLFARSGHVLGRARTDAQGRYRVRLSAGTYSVRRPIAPAIGRGLTPRQVRVRGGRVTRVDFFIDTGIR